MKRQLGFGVTLCLLGTVPALAQSANNSGAFPLGQIETVTVTAQRAGQQGPQPMSESTLTNDDTYTFHDIALNQSLDMMPGVAAANSGGPRNEQLLFVHGFDRFETPISIDGIRVYLPADNRLDFSRFLTADLSEIQVAKGYVSVLNGPGAMGAAINLVTKKPVNEFEADARAGMTLGNSGSLDTSDASVSLGTNQGLYYLQASAAWSETARTELSDGFTPTASQPAGFRVNSQSRDLTLHVKAGYTPNATDEYSISYIEEKGGKDAPFSVVDPISTQRDWTWPYWDISSVYFLSNTALNDSAYLKSRVYYNTFTNGLYSYDNPTFTKQSLPKSFDSFYDDYAYGGNLELGDAITEDDTLKASFFYRRDSHDEWETIFSPHFTEPHQLTVEDTYSLAAENSWHATDRLDVVAGISYDWRHLYKAQDYVDPSGATKGKFVNYPLSDGNALNGQAALIYNATADSSYYANVSDRTRFPTIFERFSTRFNSAASNPGLTAERAANFEIGTKQTFGEFHFDGSVFYSDISDAIESVILPAPAPAGTTQSQNVGHGAYYGAEFELVGALSDNLTGGLNYTYQMRHIHVPSNVAPLRLTGDPEHKSFIYLNWATPLEGLTVTPSLSLASNRWATNTAGTVFFRTGSYALGGLSADYAFADHFDLNVGIKNLFDANYQLAGGFPEQGRTFFAELRFRQ